MYTLLRTSSYRSIVLEQLPPLAISLIIAEMFYHFHSFTLEAVAFLGTWYVIDAAYTFVRGLIGEKENKNKN